MNKYILMIYTPFALWGEPLNLQQAICQALAHSFDLQQADADRDAARGDVIQAGLFPNPELSVDWGSVGFINSSEDEEQGIVYELEQLIELGGKRGARKCLAEVEQEKAEIAYELEQLKLIAEVKDVYYLASRLLEDRKGLQRKVEIGEELLTLLQERLDAGTISPQIYYDVAYDLQNYPFELNENEIALEAALGELSCLLGCEATPLCDLAPLPPPPTPPTTIQTCLTHLPAARMQDLLVDAAWKVYLLEEANGIPDLSIRCEVEQDQKGKHAAFGIGASIDLPFFDRNQGNRSKAWALWRKAEIEQQHFFCHYEREIKNAFTKVSKTYQLIAKMKSNILNPTFARLTQFQEKQKAGHSDRREVLEAEVGVLDAEQKYRALVTEYLLALTEYQRLTEAME